MRQRRCASVLLSVAELHHGPVVGLLTGWGRCGVEICGGSGAVGWGDHVVKDITLVGCLLVVCGWAGSWSCGYEDVGDVFDLVGEGGYGVLECGEGGGDGLLGLLEVGGGGLKGGEGGMDGLEFVEGCYSVEGEAGVEGCVQGCEVVVDAGVDVLEETGVFYA